jgi:hypothetical protein
MRIGAVITIVGAHDARHAASRLTMPPPDGSCRARIQAADGRGRRQLTPALLGVG